MHFEGAAPLSQSGGRIWLYSLRQTDTHGPCQIPSRSDAHAASSRSSCRHAVMHEHIYTHTHSCAPHTHAHARHKHTHTHTHTYARTHTHTHAHTHTHIIQELFTAED